MASSADTSSLSKANLSTTSSPANHMIPSPTSSCIHILGTGNFSRLFAHALATSPNPPPITLHFHRPSLLKEWAQAGSKITIVSNGIPAGCSNYDIETAEEKGPISNLIITTKTTTTTAALRALKHRLSSNSTLLFTQNGLGIIDEVTSNLFPVVSTRPHYLASVATHGVYSLSSFHSVHAGFGTISIGSNSSSPQPSSSSPTSSPPYLLTKITSSHILNATPVPSTALFKLQLEKLVINALINPLCILFHCQNGELINNSFPPYPLIQKLQKAMLAEISAVIQVLPELQGDEERRERFGEEKLGKLVKEVNWMVRENFSSMYQDVKEGRGTEVGFINGWIVKKGKEMGSECKVNERVVELVGRGFPEDGTNVEGEFEGVL